MKYGDETTKIGPNLPVLFVCLFSLLFIFITVLPVRGEISQDEIVKPGDRAKIHVTCKENNGLIILTTYKELSEDTSKKKSDIYTQPNEFLPLRIVAGRGDQYSGTDPLKTFNNELAAKLSEAIIGMKVGESASLKLKAPVPEGLKKEDRYIDLSKIRIFPKKITLKKSQFKNNSGKELEVGQEIPNAVGLSAKIMEIKDDDVKLAYVGEEGGRIETPWGIGILHDKGDDWNLELKPHIGRLVRTGPYVGRVVSVGDKDYKMDFGCPFGNEIIICDISVISIMEKSDEKEL